MPYKNARDLVKIAAKCRVFVGSPRPSLGGSGGSSWLGLGEFLESHLAGGGEQGPKSHGDVDFRAF